jgi:hypothetical protein
MRVFDVPPRATIATEFDMGHRPSDVGWNRDVRSNASNTHDRCS